MPSSACGSLTTADTTLQHQRRRHVPTASSTQAANATPVTSAAREGGFVVKRTIADILRRLANKLDKPDGFAWYINGYATGANATSFTFERKRPTP